MGCCCSCVTENPKTSHRGGGSDAPRNSMTLTPNPAADAPLAAPAPPCSCHAGLNLNTAPSEAFQRIRGVGRVLADGIVAARPYPTGQGHQVLLRVKGIGERKAARIGKHLCSCFGGAAQPLGDGGDGGGRGGVSVTGDSGPSGAEVPQPEDVGELVICPSAPLPRDATQVGAGAVLPAPAAAGGAWGDGLRPAEFAAAAFNALATTDDVVGAATVSVCSWNIRHFSSRRDKLRARAVANVLRQFDVVAIQEVRDVAAVQALHEALNQHSRWPVWRFAVSPFAYNTQHSEASIIEAVAAGTQPESQPSPHGRGHHRHRERYAFVWQAHRVRLVGAPVLLDHVTTTTIMGRAPFAARFQVRTEGGLDMIVMSTHIVFSGGEASRRTEVQKLCHIATTLPKVLPHVSDNTRQIVVGGTGWVPLVSGATTIFGSVYDNIFVRERTRSCSTGSGVSCVDHALYPDTRRAYNTRSAEKARRKCNQELSDHRPVWAQFRARVDL